MIVIRTWKNRYRFVVGLSLCILFFPNRTYSQDTVVLKNVEITAEKTRFSETGKKTEMVDSTLKSQFRFNSLADVLSYNSAVFIKNYGSGGIASTTLRGGNASQTAILWNGFNIQNGMLGQADLSLLPAVLFDNVEIEYGGSSALWGSGAVGGSILLGNRTAFGQGWSTMTNIGYGSLNSKNASTRITFSGSKFTSSTKLYINDSENKFRYKNAVDNKIQQAKYADHNFKGLMQEFKLLVGTNQVLSFSAWLNSNYRHLPAYNLQTNSKAYQYDYAGRFTLDWAYMTNRFKSGIRAGYFNDRIDYNDSIAALFSKSKVQTKIIESDNYWQWNKNNRANFGVNVTSSSAKTENYVSEKTLSRVSLIAGNRLSVLDQKLSLSVSARGEFFSVGTLPITGNVSGEYKLNQKVKLSLNAAKVYRQPTLNELYWIPGGNNKLKPEQGYTYEGSVNYLSAYKYLRFYFNAAAFSRQIDNWILWLPGANGNPSPLNLQKVWSRGTESSWKINYEKGKLKLGFGIITTYVLSTVQVDRQENSGTVGKQIIYTPRYTANANVLVGYDKLFFTFFHQYAGYRFTASDNSQWLDPYHVSSLKVNYTQSFKNADLILFSSCNNLFNSNYSVIAWRPMPLRNYEFGITIQTKHKTNNKK